MTPFQIIRTARALVGIPYVSKGRTMGGLDCAGVVVLIARSLKLPFPHDPQDYERANRLGFVVDQCKRSMREVSRTYAQPGMIVVMQPGRALVHLGVLDSMGTVISAANEPDAMKVERRPIDWRSVRAVFAYEGVDY